MSSIPVSKRMQEFYHRNFFECNGCGIKYVDRPMVCECNPKNGSESIITKRASDVGKVLSASVVREMPEDFSYLRGGYVTAITEFDGVRYVDQVTDIPLTQKEFDVSGLVGKDVISVFRKFSTHDGLINYGLKVTPVGYLKQLRQNDQDWPKEDKAGIIASGVYVPKWKLKTGTVGKEFAMEVSDYQKRVPYIDEDTATMAVEGGRIALANAGIKPNSVSYVRVGSESHPYEVKPTATILVHALGLGKIRDDIHFVDALDTEFACKAASGTWMDCIRYSDKTGENSMTAGYDNSQAKPGDALDISVGAGGSTQIFGKTAPIALIKEHIQDDKFRENYVSVTSDTPDFYRAKLEKYPTHGGRFTGEPAFFKHQKASATKLMEKLNLKPKDIDFFVSHSPNPQFPRKLGSELEFEPRQLEPLTVDWTANTYQQSGIGTASVFDIAKPGQKILVVTFGSSAGSDAHLLETTDYITQKRNQYPVWDMLKSPDATFIEDVFPNPYLTYRRFKEGF